MFHLYAACVACKKERYFVRTRTYRFTKEHIKKKPHLSSLNGMRSEGELCNKCYKDILKATLQ